MSELFEAWWENLKSDRQNLSDKEIAFLAFAYGRECEVKFISRYLEKKKNQSKGDER